jgi:hypothetical protein
MFFSKTMIFYYPYQKAEIKKGKIFLWQYLQAESNKKGILTTVICKNYRYLGVEVDRLHVPDFVEGAL